MPSRVFRVSIAGLVVELRCADVAVASELLDLLHLGAVLEGIGDGGLSEAVNADAAAAEANGGDADLAAVALDHLPDRVSGEWRSSERLPILTHCREERGCGSVDQAGDFQPAEEGSVGVQEGLAL